MSIGELVVSSGPGEASCVVLVSCCSNGVEALINSSNDVEASKNSSASQRVQLDIAKWYCL